MSLADRQDHRHGGGGRGEGGGLGVSGGQTGPQARGGGREGGGLDVSGGLRGHPDEEHDSRIITQVGVM